MKCTVNAQSLRVCRYARYVDGMSYQVIPQYEVCHGMSPFRGHTSILEKCTYLIPNLQNATCSMESAYFYKERVRGIENQREWAFGRVASGVLQNPGGVNFKSSPPAATGASSQWSTSEEGREWRERQESYAGNRTQTAKHRLAEWRESAKADQESRTARLEARKQMAEQKAVGGPQTGAGRASDRQVGGSHYKGASGQPWDVVDTWPVEQRIGFYRGNALKYLMRAGTKGTRLEDIGKAEHYLQKLLEVLHVEVRDCGSPDVLRPAVGRAAGLVYPNIEAVA